MTFRDRPLLVDGIDADLYVARRDIERRTLGALKSGRNVLLLGEAGSGKTTLLRWLRARLRSDAHDVVIVNAALAQTTTDVLALIAAEFRGLPGAISISDMPSAQEFGERVKHQRSPAGGLIVAARRLRRDRPATILLDGLMDSEIAFDLFARLRDELWDLEHTWCVAVRPRDSAALRSPPADAFWGAVVELPPLSLEEKRILLQRGLVGEELDRVLAAFDDHVTGATFGDTARSVIRAAQAILDDAPTGPDPVLLGQHLAQLGRSESMAMAELQGLARPVSAQDEELLSRLGWSRPNAQRVLGSLERKGLLRAISERSEGQGRPRKLYEINPNLPAL